MGAEHNVQVLLIKEFQLVNIKGMREIGNHHSDTLVISYYRQEALMSVEIFVQNYDEKQDICIV